MTNINVCIERNGPLWRPRNTNFDKYCCKYIFRQNSVKLILHILLVRRFGKLRQISPSNEFCQISLVAPYMITWSNSQLSDVSLYHLYHQTVAIKRKPFSSYSACLNNLNKVWIRSLIITWIYQKRNYWKEMVTYI